MVIILWINGIATVVGIVATVLELMGRKNGHKPYGAYEKYINVNFVFIVCYVAFFSYYLA